MSATRLVLSRFFFDSTPKFDILFYELVRFVFTRLRRMSNSEISSYVDATYAIYLSQAWDSLCDVFNKRCWAAYVTENNLPRSHDSENYMRLCVHLSISTLLAQRPKIADFTCSMPFQSITPANLCTICSSLKYRDANFLPLTILACTIRYDTTVCITCSKKLYTCSKLPKKRHSVKWWCLVQGHSRSPKLAPVESL